MIPDRDLHLDLCDDNDNAADKPEEACGVFGIYAPGQDVARLTYFGLYALQHRGQESAGIATFDGRQLHEHRDMGLVSHVFSPEVLTQLPGQLAIGHTRYSTTGSSRRCNAQPVIVETKLGKLALAHNGNLVNTAELQEYLLAKGCELNTTIDSEMIALVIREEVNAGKGWVEATISVWVHLV
jgi:amidophosphoribosyltransferase